MSEIIILVILFALTRGLRALQKAYLQVPSRELRRRSAKGDQNSHRMYLAARYEARLRLFLEVLIVLCLAVFIFYLFEELNLKSVWSVALTAIVIFYFLVITPTTRSRPISRKAATKLSPVFAEILKFASPVLYALEPSGYSKKRYEPLYDSTDLVNFLNKQKHVSNTRISKVDINRAIQSLEQRDMFVHDVMTTKKDMKLLREDDEIGPILLSELHKSGQDCFAVVDQQDEIIGTVLLKKLVKIKEGGEVSRYMRKKLAYVSSGWLISESIAAFLETDQKAFLVVNNDKKVVGIISLSVLLGELIDVSSESKKHNFLDVDDVSAS